MTRSRKVFRFLTSIAVGVAVLGAPNFGAQMAQAQSQPSVGQASPQLLAALGEALQMDRTLVIMQREAVKSSAQLADELFAVGADRAWNTTVTALFDPAAARKRFDQSLAAASASIDAAHVQAAIDFFLSPLGRKTIEMETSAREQLLDPAREAAAKQAWAAGQGDNDPATSLRAQLVQDVVAANDLIETNVMAALNGNLAFYQGMSLSGAFAAPMSSEDMLAEVSAQETQIRADMEDWLFPYLGMAYSGLTEDELRAYIAFANSAAGKSLSKLVFFAFDELGKEQSRALGLAAGRMMAGQDI